MLHIIFQRHHITPDEIFNKPRNVKRFIYASEQLALEEEEKARKKAERNNR